MAEASGAEARNAHPPRDAGDPRWTLPCVLALVLFGVGFGFWGIGSGTLRLWDEALTAERAREMLLLREFLTPHLAFHPDFNKPPLYYTAVALLYAVLGVGEAAARVPSVLFALACAGLAGLLAAGRARDARAGLIAAVVLLTNPYWVNKTREALLDSGMLFGLLGAWWGLRQASQGNRWGAAIAGGAAAIGALVKGPLALLAWPLAAAEARLHGTRIPARAFWGSLLFAAVLVLPWYVLQGVLHGREWALQFFGYSIGVRLAHAIEGHQQPPWFYLLAWGRVAWAGLALLVVAAWSGRALHCRAAWPSLGLLALLLGALSAAGSKREAYLVLLFPAAAIATGVLAAAAWERTAPSLRRRALAVLAVALLVPFLRSYKARMNHGREHAEAGRAVTAALTPGAVLLLRDVPPQSLLFYSGATRVARREGELPRTADFPLLIAQPANESAPEGCAEQLYRGREVAVWRCVAAP